jgi:hypothetical protein
MFNFLEELLMFFFAAKPSSPHEPVIILVD